MTSVDARQVVPVNRLMRMPAQIEEVIEPEE